MKPFLNRLTAGCLFVASVVLACGAAPGTLDRGRPLPMDDVTLAYIGREALSRYGYEEIIKRAVDAGFLRYPSSEEANAQNLVGQTLDEAARQAWPVFTRYAVAAAIASQMDSPAPGPGDAAALGMLVVGLVRAGVVGAMVLTMSSDATTAKPTTTTTAPPIPIGVPRQSCPPCITVGGRIVPVGATAYRPLDTPATPQHGIAGPHYNIYKANQAPTNSPQPCKCFWQAKGTVSPADLPADAIPIEPFANPGG